MGVRGWSHDFPNKSKMANGGHIKFRKMLIRYLHTIWYNVAICGRLRTTAARRLSAYMAVWLSGNALASINVVALRQTRLVLGWVTVCGRVNHFGM